MTSMRSGAAVSEPMLSDGTRRAVRDGFDAGRAAYGDLSVAFPEYEAYVVAAASRHWRSQGEEATPARIEEHVRSGALADLYLAASCDGGREVAWSAFSERFRRRLEGFAVRRGLSSGEAEARVQDLLGDLAMPPSRPGIRTMLGSYDGTGSLFGWLCVVLLRRIAGAARSRKSASLEAQSPETVEASFPVAAAGPEPDPATASAHSEETARFDGALGEAWATLSDQERLALLLKHRDGLAQRRIAGLLGVGEPRVSRVVASAVDKLRGRLRGPAGERPSRADPPNAPLLAAAIARLLARDGPGMRPTLGPVRRTDAARSEGGPGSEGRPG